MIYITIHALSTWNEAGKTQGHCDAPLSQTGLDMAERLAERSDLDSVRAIITSDLMRSRLTAEPLARRLRLPIHQREDLREGNWPHHYRDPELAPKPCSYGWETREQLALRSSTTMRAVAESAISFPILVVTHGAFFSTFLSTIDPDALKDYRKIRTALNTFRFENGVWSIVSMNDDRHLHDLSRDDRDRTALDQG